jgi:hypothetical protein
MIPAEVFLFKKQVYSREWFFKTIGGPLMTLFVRSFCHIYVIILWSFCISLLSYDFLKFSMLKFLHFCFHLEKIFSKLLFFCCHLFVINFFLYNSPLFLWKHNIMMWYLPWWASSVLVWNIPYCGASCSIPKKIQIHSWQGCVLSKFCNTEGNCLTTFEEVGKGWVSEPAMDNGKRERRREEKRR